MRQYLKNMIMRKPRGRSCQRGNISTLFSFMLVPMTAAVGVSMDLASQNMMRVNVEQAADAALLAATRVINVDPNADLATMRKLARQQFLANIGDTDNIQIKNLEFNRDPDTGQTSLDVDVRMGTYFMRVAGIDEATIKTRPTAYASVTQDETPSVDMILVVDVSGSMRGNKIKELKNASKALVDIVLPESNLDSRISLIPYHSSVRNNWLLDLTNTVGTIKGKINDLAAGGGTNSAKGMRKAEDFLEAIPATSTNDQVVLLLTDGYNNNKKDDKKTKKSCKRMKDDNVTVYTVAFGNISGRALTMLKDCATSEDTYYHVKNTSQLTEVFKHVAAEYTYLRLSS